MDRRSRQALPYVALIVIGGALLASQSGLGASPSGAPLGGPHSSVADPTTFAAVGSTAMPLVTPQGVSAKAIGSSGKPGKTPAPSSNPSPPPRSNPTPAPTPKPTAHPTAAPTSNPAPCPMFPSDNVWNKRVDGLPVRSDSSTLVGSIGLGSYLHPDFSSTAWNGGLGYGIPFNKVTLSTPRRAVTFRWADESDAGPYPIPTNPKIEGGSDRHILLWDTEGCDLYELFNARASGSSWLADSGAIWDLRSNALRPNGWTSADAAGLPILPGLVRYDQVAAGAILHALRFTAPKTCGNHIYPARHDAGSYSCSTNPPMGLRVRLKASVDISGFGPQARVILLALKRYGMILADNGSPWYVTGAPNAGWNDDQLHDFHQLHGSDFEVVDTSNFR